MTMDVQHMEHRLTVIEQDLKASVRLGERSLEISQETLKQAKETNGRVRALEAWKAEKEAYERGARDTVRAVRRRDLFFLSVGGGAIALIVPRLVDALWAWAAQAIAK